MMKSLSSFVALLLVELLRLPAIGQAEELQLTLPPFVYAVPDVPAGICFDNVVLTQTPEKHRFEVECRLGRSEARSWSVTPDGSDVGDHPLKITVRREDGTVLEQAQSTLRVSRADAGAGRMLRLLIVGDSLTHASLYPNQLALRLEGPGNPAWTMLGTHKPAAVKPGVAHEGYGGWRWTDFLNRFSPTGPFDANQRRVTSPFVFPSADGKSGEFDLPRYIREECADEPPDVVLFLLGINDCFASDPDNPDPKIDEVLAEVEKLLSAFHKAAPKAILGVGLTTPPNSRQEAFEANYKQAYSRWGWKRIQHRLVQRMLKQFSGREGEGIHVVPTELGLDPINGYPSNNGVHPNVEGYAQVGDGFYAWLKAVFQAP
jgi:hypothetical protein